MFTKGERPVLANMVSCFVRGLRGMKQGCLVGFVAAFCIFTKAPEVPKEVLLVLLYEQRGQSHPGCFPLSFAPVRNEQLGLCLLIIWLVWFSLFMF